MLDKNLIVDNTIGEPDVRFYDVRQDPFEVYGFYRYREEADFKRLPDDVAKSVSPRVAQLYLNTSGGRVRFSTDSQYVAIKVDMPEAEIWAQMPLNCSSGFDLYLDDPESGASRFIKPLSPTVDVVTQKEYSSKFKFRSRKLRHFTICFPTYSNVRNLWIGLQEDAILGEGVKYRKEAPIVYYGSSITQGAGASRPGNIYQNMVCRQTGIDYLNLGFSGNARGEKDIAKYIAGLKMSIFVCDYDHNAPNDTVLRETHCRLYQIFREAQPDTPIIMLSRPDMDGDVYEMNERRRDVVIDTYRYARSQGDTNTYLIDGAEIFRGPHEFDCTSDSIHPNDIGYAMMADAIVAAIYRIRTQKYV